MQALNSFKSQFRLPLVLQSVALLFYSFSAHHFFNLGRPHGLWLGLLAYSMLLDLSIGRIFFRTWRIPYTAIVIACACSILIESHTQWIYFLAATLGILSKALLTKDGRHFFNPANFAVCAILLLRPDLATSVPTLFSSQFYFLFVLLWLGLIVAFVARQLSTALFWAAFFLAGAWIRTYWQGIPIAMTARFALSPAFLLFTFHMITDPATSPRTARGRLMYGGFIAAFDGLARALFIPNGNLVALFLWSAVRFLRAQAPGKYWTFAGGALALPALLFLFIYNGTGDYSGGMPVWARSPAFAKKDPSLQLRNATAEKQLTLRHRNPRVHESLAPYLAFNYYAPGATAEDFNGDGFLDLAVVQEGGFRLFLNEKGRRFRDATAEWGVVQFADFAPTVAVPFRSSPKGRPDILLLGYGCARYLSNTGSRFSDQSRKFLGDCVHGSGASVLDRDGDGFLDLYVHAHMNPNVDFFRGTNLENFSPTNLSYAANGSRNYFLMNRAGARLEKEYDAGDEKTFWTLDSAAADLDGDGRVDLFVANDWGPDSFFKVEKNRLEDESHRGIYRDRASGMTASVGWGVNGRASRVFISNIWIPKYVQQGNYLWNFFDAEGRNLISDNATSANVINCGWAWAAAFADLRNSGSQDIYVANGFISRNPSGEYWPAFRNEFRMGTLGVAASAMGGVDFRKFSPKDNFAGFQRDCLFRSNPGRETFSNVAASSGVNAVSDSRAVVAADFTNTGRVDLVVTAQDGDLIYWENSSEGRGAFGEIQLRDRHGNNQIAGARVKIFSDNLFRFVIPTTAGKLGFLSFGGQRLHFGLGEASKFSAEVLWPGGKLTTHKELEAGHLYELSELGGERELW